MSSDEPAPILPPETIGQILSYLIRNPREFADLRKISKSWNEKILPRAMKDSKILEISSLASKNPFLKELVSFDGDEPLTGTLFTFYRMDYKEFFPILDPSVEVESILLGTDLDDCFKKPITIAKGEKDDDDKFSRYCKTICGTKSLEEFQETVTIAMQQGMFLSVEYFEQAKKEGAKFFCPQDSLAVVPIILTVTLPLEDAIISGNKVLINIDMDEVLKDQLAPFEPGETEGMITFAGYNFFLPDDRDVTCQVPMLCNFGETIEYLEAENCLPVRSLWSKCQEQTIKEGVAIADGVVSPELRASLMVQIDAFARQQTLDYHPGSKNIVRDIVHPALYSYVKGVSPLIHSRNEVPPCTFSPENFDEDLDSEPEDYWGREYEESAKYQWLPTYFDVDLDGNCEICDYINNLVPRSEHEELYTSLADLFSQTLPLLESVYSYCRVVKGRLRQDNEELDYDSRIDPKFEEIPVSLRGKRLQVITKIVDYELGPGKTYEGVWHVEGMSHEEIVATSIYFIDRDEDIVGGDILFKRAFHRDEATFIFSNIGQCRQPEVDEMISKNGLMPLGQVKTLQGRFIAFPNSHVHKVTKLENVADSRITETTKRHSTTKKRRIIVFFLINPEKRIVSTREVPPQQEHVGGSMKRVDALDHRKQLMKERKYTKQDWNVREIELCEH